jgi:hypothetical protein
VPAIHQPRRLNQAAIRQPFGAGTPRSRPGRWSPRWCVRRQPTDNRAGRIHHGRPNDTLASSLAVSSLSPSVCLATPPLCPLYYPLSLSATGRSLRPTHPVCLFACMVAAAWRVDGRHPGSQGEGGRRHGPTPARGAARQELGGGQQVGAHGPLARFGAPQLRRQACHQATNLLRRISLASSDLCSTNTHSFIKLLPSRYHFTPLWCRRPQFF